jgi:hypothetical protein
MGMPIPGMITGSTSPCWRPPVGHFDPDAMELVQRFGQFGVRKVALAR